MRDSTLRVTINPAQQPNDDTFKPGTLVKSDLGVILVANKTQYSATLFCGVVIQHEEFCPGDYSDAWSKEAFVKFVGNIVLEQE